MKHQDVKSILNSHNIKATRQRVEIYKVLQNSQQCLSADEILQLLKTQNLNIDLATVYRNLELFVQNGIAVKSTINRKHFFEIKKSSHHHYFVCIKCNAKAEIVDCKINLIEEELNKMNFKILDHNLEVYGICDKCCGREE
ncbi:ferric uptake regulator, Fur family [Caldicellulosiruptor hydrothermalis 108]|uniref:Ferric uptake regulator, Fur family n=1 Tax=Caldicellulosiruptor hydrothermalis (strain DSM 18901 / VKM B-2411 / 108) TaxID=632292 RepID=E4QCU1_CALH1|nr:Fur family transcriptional regulator [Caldicellulosiruptor hydrothermalis]ADQ06310.1 ferric uptake regulator, Fur family [Caldicellulosiruptor hydrothermalis 108]